MLEKNGNTKKCCLDFKQIVLRKLKNLRSTKIKL